LITPVAKGDATAMTDKDVLGALERLGTEQNRKVYKRHGAGDNLYGVSFANLYQVAKKIKVDHDLALKLWATGNFEAQILATMIADPAKANDRLLESWVKDLSNYVVTDQFAGYVSKTSLARNKMEKWVRSNKEWVGRVGWDLLGRLAMNDDVLPDGYFEKYLAAIERDIHTSKNYVRHAMNAALISIGIRNGKLEKKALAAAKRIGKVEVDHGETNCKTPDAAAYIYKAAARKRKKS
jgi:3-methyladenine DNA glycosylase AlkD